MITFIVLLILTSVEIYIYVNFRRELKDHSIRTDNNNRHLIELRDKVVSLEASVDVFRQELAALNPKNVHAKLVTIEEEVNKQLRSLNDRLS